MERTDPRDRALDVLLAERLGGRAPPDLTARILAAASRGELPEPEHEPAVTADSRHSTERDPTFIPTEESTPMTAPQTSDLSFTAAAATASRGLLGEFYGFVRDNTKWWLVPFLVVFGLLGLVLALGATGAAPFIYTLF